MASYTLQIVDDEEMMQEYYEVVLGETFFYRHCLSGTACLESLHKSGLPDLILLDVSMPGMDGYETCRKIRQQFGLETPVIFISARDQLQDKLLGYESGGNDYIVKPFEVGELISKVHSLISTAEQQKRLKSAVNEAGSTAMTAMSSMAEMGVVLFAMKDIVASLTIQAVAEVLLKSIAQFGLNGVMWLHCKGQDVCVSTQGTPTPIEVSAVRLVAEMGRIVEFKTRLSISYAGATLLVSNLPIEDAERVGRLRDHLMMLVEVANERVQTLCREMQFKMTATSAIHTLAEVDQIQREFQLRGNQALDEVTRDFERAYVQLALTEEQENYMAGIMQAGFERVRESILANVEVQTRFTDMISRLKLVSQ